MLRTCTGRPCMISFLMLRRGGMSTDMHAPCWNVSVAGQRAAATQHWVIAFHL